MNSAVFLDKDGTLIDDVPYNVNPEIITLSSGSVTGLLALQHAGFKLIIVTNQSGVARGYFKQEALIGVEQKIRLLFQNVGLALDGFYYCPHLPDGAVDEFSVSCNCRKPMPGLLNEAAKLHNIHPGSSWMIGDILNDVEAGNRAGVRSILINNGNETEWVPGEYRKPVYKASNIDEAAAFILSHRK